MRILVTGGAGYIGSVLVPLLLEEGHEVTVLDNLMYGQTPLLDCCLNPHFEFVSGDARDAAIVRPLVSKADVVLPLACLTGAPICNKDPWAARGVLVDAVKVIVDHLSPSQMLIFPSTNSGYGVGENDLHCDEDTPLRPVSLYGRLKVEIESLLLDAGHSVTFRFATLFGMSPRPRLDLLVNDFTYRALKDRFVVLFEGHFKRNYLHVRDAAHAFSHTISNYESMKGRAFNIGLSDANLSKIELCERIKLQVPDFVFVSADVGKDPDQRNYIVSNARIEATGFKPSVSLDEGIRELLTGYRILRPVVFANA